jgi:tight adherence protein B
MFASIVFLLTALSAGSLLLAALYPRFAATSALDQRLSLLAGSSARVRRPGMADDREHRRRPVDEILRELEERRKAAKSNRAKPSLSLRMRQADLDWNTTTYGLVCATVGISCFVTMSGILALGVFPSAGFAIAAGLAMPHVYVSFRRKKRFARFLTEFPNAVDVVVRGVKTGLPVIECLKIIATESRQPVRDEFLKIVDDQALGMPLAEAVERMAERIPLPEVTFFSIVIAIQSSTGGGLSEALGNLARVLRERRRMQAKVQAMSAEAKASAGIIGSLPVFVAGAVYLTSPAYIELLFTTLIGHVVLYASGVWMTMGVLVMRKMINFKI